jgi:hypothetical protein
VHLAVLAVHKMDGQMFSRTNHHLELTTVWHFGISYSLAVFCWASYGHRPDITAAAEVFGQCFFNGDFLT